jgi:hypothetical protein
MQQRAVNDLPEKLRRVLRDPIVPNDFPNRFPDAEYPDLGPFDDLFRDACMLGVFDA